MTELHSDVFRFLGGERALGIEDPNDPLALHKVVLRGVPAKSAVYFKDYVGLSNVLFAVLLGVSEKTFIRWQQTPRKAIGPVASDRLVRTVKIMALAEQVLESNQNAKQWLNERQSALGGETPRDLLSTDVGAQQVKDLLLQMEHGYLA